MCAPVIIVKLVRVRRTDVLWNSLNKPVIEFPLADITRHCAKDDKVTVA